MNESKWNFRKKEYCINPGYLEILYPVESV